MKTLDEYQKAVKKIAQEFNFNWTIYVQFIHLVEEVAELGEALTVYNGDRKAGEEKAALADHSDIEEEGIRTIKSTEFRYFNSFRKST
ncbi:hypothetical protein COW98_02155 [Candidatus Roizmanbacteria bacterium CG22_combo_CG10-13_8_21_14_all_35_9]|uniref:Uncharacterized protein n=4 Tax=Patescibacteria group TaxID=1783273 RepID=A0A1J4T7T1_9BACT|nr:MAG: hypothetical protein AUJ27_01130 [Candidatus Falkowbacteria bacterium CG1_02_37_44]PIP14605.1 MAG: hypothetical protein COX47_04310 [Candidatus Roizmanbacteria bacterium CG23_combo_of_CG06-09_8_20_14_all_35_49]PIP62775.1 MAG: hypothetical protein COW98_02155 [Candidatus Roizmanbacteria bacterium CG22_combo_CG10-13_8_21_14_all_35_9]PIY71066.1 MAG: hypothetical protein COY88_02310 [Candidatus Roizmanbacteria bacterium CG_4_10_14_0_8_um_filter_35_28]